MFRFVERKASYVNGKRDNEVKRTRRETPSSVRDVESRSCTKKEGKTRASDPRVVSVQRYLISKRKLQSLFIILDLPYFVCLRFATQRHV